MKRVLLRSVYDAVDYVLDHYYPFGMEDAAPRRDSYAVISIQDTHTKGFGLTFSKSVSCVDVLTLYFDDIEREVPGAMLFSEEQASQIIEFIRKNRDADTLMVHCYGGESRSRAVAAFADEMLGLDSSKHLNGGHPNRYVLETLKRVAAARAE